MRGDVASLTHPPIRAPAARRFHARWYYLFTFQGKEFGEAEVLYLTARALGTSESAMLSEEFDRQSAAFGGREGLLARKLWIEENFAKYQKECSDSFKAKRPGMHKRALRLRKKGKGASYEGAYSDDADSDYVD